MPNTIIFGMNTMFAVRQFLPEALECVRNRGMRPVVVAPADEPPSGADPEFPGVEFHAIHMRREISPFSDLRALWELWRVMKKVQPSVANLSTPKMALVGGLAAWLARVPTRIYTIRGLRYETTRSLKRRLLMLCEWVACACAHRVICISRSVQATLVKDGIAPARKTVLLGERVSEGIKIREPLPPDTGPAVRGRLGIPEDAPVIGFVGRLTRDKGIHELVDCVKILRRTGWPVHLILLGTAEPGDPIDADVERWLRSDVAVHWPGYVDDPRPYYAAMDVFVFPSHREGLGRVLLEAAAAGKPVVSTHTTGIEDVVLNGITGLLVDVGDADAMAVATTELLANRQLAARLGAAAQLLVREQFDNAVYMRRLGDTLERLTHGDNLSELKESANAADQVGGVCIR